MKAWELKVSRQTLQVKYKARVKNNVLSWSKPLLSSYDDSFKWSSAHIIYFDFDSIYQYNRIIDHNPC